MSNADIEKLQEPYRRRLVELDIEFKERARPLIDALAKLEAMKTPPPIVISIDDIPQWLKDTVKNVTDTQNT